MSSSQQRRFPESVDRSVGKFWHPGSPASFRAGVCSVHDDRIELDVLDGLTPTFESDEPVAGVQLHRPAARESPAAIHGRVPMMPVQVTLLDAYTVTRDSIGFPGDDEDSHEVLSARWLVAGAHVVLEQRYERVRARFSHLEPWARRVSVNRQIKERATAFGHEWQPPETVSAPFTEYDESATLELTSSGTFGSPDVWGSRIETHNWLELKDLSGWTLEEVFARFVRPTNALLTLLAGETSTAAQVEVWVEDEWIPVHGEGIDAQKPPPVGARMLVDQSSMPLGTLARWVGRSQEYSPVPFVVASATSGAFATIEAEAIALLTSLETLDHLLRPNKRVVPESQVETARELLETSGLPSKVRKKLVSFLRHIDKPGFERRATHVMKDVTAAVPDIVTTAHSWGEALGAERNTLAHGVQRMLADDATEEAALWRTYHLTRSLRWALTVNLLQLAGVEDAAIRNGLAKSPRFRVDRRGWTRELPEIFTA